MNQHAARTLESANQRFREINLEPTARFSAIAWIEDYYDCFYCPCCGDFVNELGVDGCDCVDCEHAFKVKWESTCEK